MDIPLALPYRFRPFLHQDPGGSKRRAHSGGPHPSAAALRRELGPDGHETDLALRELPLTHHHRQVRAVPGVLLPGVAAGEDHAPLVTGAGA